MRTPVFELHIQPMFRATDRVHMSSFFDLWDYDAVVAQADDILIRLEDGMPPVTHGGPWPEEWIELFRRWKDGARKRLELGTATYTLDQTSVAVTITATGTFPAAGCAGWLQLDNETDTAKTYVLYVEQPDAPVAGTPAAFTLKERYRAADTRSVFVRDATGVQQLH
ncbi:hypothetical protein GCM10010503_36060 [Streptomyces lucensis JCM 4490]|uniref:Uncharacterized protein n=1 Tax=Streptomyces lucensis JCM 4490 TaxID=1306176 RepID=A0A918MT63_9ACTN|nr:hypothetical protein [Streptomyces lucensis]GGW55754.1 hypothetical protein GCM10010503_36060 [Streptomyces lucensis JCM 4490]